ncbi:MAG: formate dehydrogenase accessory sulfurtransferase FdhD [Candidatus Eisenbacteria bacterium]|uniref:Sulfur carrier protein FdhD n=1 Tax=Eiseniibacteriota bacterium TaxID=2212470 RepID=A0A948WEZ1_UNCEI|nr:formate dehydrogenase accessory sulfurtransferase FdhD [Candidatus Eisenbacteria bacterium]
MRSVRITRLTEKRKERVEDLLIREERFDLYLNGKHLIALVCLPSDLKAFIVGFLVNEGILSAPYTVDLDIDEAAARIDAHGDFHDTAIQDFFAKKTLTSGCGSGVTGQDLEEPIPCLKVDTDFRIQREVISNFMHVMKEEASLFQQTGGAHIAALADAQGRLLMKTEDIGRHTAVDKVIGMALLSGIDPSRCVLFSSGRLSSEITAKAIHARTPVLVSRGAPTDLAVRLARRFLLTLVGFARGRRMNIYSAAERIIE